MHLMCIKYNPSVVFFFFYVNAQYSAVTFSSWECITSTHKEKESASLLYHHQGSGKDKRGEATSSLGITIKFPGVWQDALVCTARPLQGSIQKVPSSNWGTLQWEQEPPLSCTLLNPHWQPGFSVVSMNIRFHYQIFSWSNVWLGCQC